MDDQFDPIKLFPGDLYECMSEDTISIRLKKWAKAIQILGTALSAVTASAGFIASISIASAADEGWLFWPLMFSFLISAGVIFLSLTLTSLMLYAITSVVYHNKVTAYTSVYVARASDRQAEKTDNGVERKNYGAVNKTGGRIKTTPGSAAYNSGGSARSEPSEGMIQCPQCGTWNRSNRTICFKCESGLISSDEEPLNTHNEVTTKDKQTVLKYALKYQTDEGLRDYLKREVDFLSEEDREQIEWLVGQPIGRIRDLAKKILASEK